MQIVITDGFTLNPGDLSWKAFYELGEVIYHDRTASNQMAERCKNAHIIITNKTPVSAEVIDAAKELRLIAVTATGYNMVDVAAAKKRGILVCNVPDYGTDSVAQHTFAMLLELTNQVGLHAASVKSGDWARSADWCYTKGTIKELKDNTIGIVGLGKIGIQMAKIAMAFGMKVIYYRGKKGLENFTEVSLQALFAQADFISIHCPLTADNNGFINKELLALMKPSAYLINASRGSLIVEQDLADALLQHKIAGAALDVLSSEPPSPQNPLIGLANCIITPHNAWISFEARSRLMKTTFENVSAMINGNPTNMV